MPDGTYQTVFAYVGYAILTFSALRVVISPYLVWKEDQASIQSLGNKISNPKVKIKEALDAQLAKDSVAVFNFLSSHRLVDLVKDRSKTNISEYTEFHGSALNLKSFDSSYKPLLDELMDSHMRAVFWMRFNADGQTWKDGSIDTFEEERKHCER